MNLASNLIDTVGRHASRTAIKLDDVELTYSALDDGTARVAGLLRAKGIQAGDRVGVMLPNVPYFAVVYYGVLRAGGVVVPMNVLLKSREVRFYLENSGAKVVFAWHEFASAAEQGAGDAGSECVLVKPGEFEQLLASAEPVPDVVDRAPEDTAVILYTSGTTGTPKGAQLTHGSLGRTVRSPSNCFR
jgi:long-chain acyl-CoA synthetase